MSRRFDLIARQRHDGPHTRIAVQLIVPSTLGPIADANPQPHPCWVYRVSCWQGVPWEDETALLLLGGLLWSFVSW